MDIAVICVLLILQKVQFQVLIQAVSTKKKRKKEKKKKSVVFESQAEDYDKYNRHQGFQGASIVLWISNQNLL